MKKQWFDSEWNGVMLDEEQKIVNVYYQGSAYESLSFEQYMDRQSRMEFKWDVFRDDVCRVICQLDMTGLTDEAVCWANLANE